MNHDHPLPPRTGKNQPVRTHTAASPKRRMGRPARVVLSLLGLVIVGLAIFAGSLLMKFMNGLDKVADPNVKSVSAAERAQVKPVSLLVLGLDYRKASGNMNTDVMMAAVFNPKTKTATVVSVPRDSDLHMEHYKTRKANAWYARFLYLGRNQENLTGDAVNNYARNQMKDLMSQFFDIPIKYTAILDFQGFVDVVNALGGVQVNVDQDMRYWDKADGTDIDLKKGPQTLNGDDALGFVRYRKSRNNSTPESSDFARNARQDQVLGSIVDKLKSFGGVTKSGGVIDAVSQNMTTDIPKDQIENMISTYFGISRQNVRFIALEGEWRSPYVHLNQAKLEEAKLALKEELQPEGRPVPTPGPSASSASQGNG